MCVPVCVCVCVCVCVYVCVCVCVPVSVSVCAVQYFFPFIGGCGVCGKMSVAHFHTPIVFQ